MDKAAHLRLVNRMGDAVAMLKTDAKYHLGQILRHRKHPFRGVVFDVDAMFSNTQDWYEAIPEDARPAKNQPFYHLFAENAETEYIAYVSEQNLLPDTSREPIRHPQIRDVFDVSDDGRYKAKARNLN